MTLKRLMTLLLCLVLLLGCSPQAEEGVLSDKTFNSIELKVLGKRAEPYEFVLEDKIVDVKEIIDNIYVKDNYLSKEGDTEIPEGISYQLTFIEQDLNVVSCDLAYGYLIINEEVYEVNDYDKVVEEIVSIFEVNYID